MSQISQKTALTITNVAFGALGVGFVVLLVLFIIKLAKGKDKSSSPTSHPTFGPTRGPTRGPISPTGGPSGPTRGPSGPTGGPSGPTTGPMFFYNANTHTKLPDDNACYSCESKGNPCGCYANNNCSISPDKFQIPPACNTIPCLQYETQDEDGVRPGVCNQNGLDLYGSYASSSCVGSDPQGNCSRACEQGSFGLPPCKSCCNAVCSSSKCSGGGGGGTPVRTYAPIPTGNVPACAECETICRLNSPYTISCDDCNKNCSNK